jgi:hypothetical protein
VLSETASSTSIDDCFEREDGGGFVEGGAVHFRSDGIAREEISVESCLSESSVYAERVLCLSPISQGGKRLDKKSPVADRRSGPFPFGAAAAHLFDTRWVLGTRYVCILIFYADPRNLSDGRALPASVPAAVPHPAVGDPGEIAAATPKGQRLPFGVLVFEGRSSRDAASE